MAPSICDHPEKPTAIQPAITQVCRQTRTEALPMFYMANEFDYHVHRCDFDILFSWLRGIGSANRKALRSLKMTLRDRWTCGKGLLDVVCGFARFGDVDIKAITISESDWINEMQQHGHVPRGNELQLTRRLLDDALDLARQIYAEGIRSERRIRARFVAWHEDDDRWCHCDLSSHSGGASLEGFCSFKVKRALMWGEGIACNYTKDSSPSRHWQ